MDSVAKRDDTAMELKKMLASDSVQARLNQCIGKRSNQFATSLLALVNGSYQLQKCEPKSILTSAMTAAALDLPIQKDLGFAWVVPYGTQAQFQIGYKGFIQLAMRTGEYKRMNAKAINAEVFEGLDEIGEPALAWDKFDPQKPVAGFMAGFTTLNGFTKTLYRSKAEMEVRAAQYSQAYRRDQKDGTKKCPWSTDFGAMGLKTVLKELLSKWALLSVDQKHSQQTEKFYKALDDDQKVGDKYLDNAKDIVDAPDKGLGGLRASMGFNGPSSASEGQQGDDLPFGDDTPPPQPSVDKAQAAQAICEGLNFDEGTVSEYLKSKRADYKFVVRNSLQDLTLAQMEALLKNVATVRREMQAWIDKRGA